MEHQTHSHWSPLVTLLVCPTSSQQQWIYHTEYLQNMWVQTEPPYQKQNNISQCKSCQAYFHTKGYCAHRPRYVKCGKSCTGHNQQHAYTVGNRIWLATEAAKSTKKSYEQDFLHPDQQQVLLLQIHRDKSESPAAPQKTEGRPKMT
jgi:hypothetical protein